MIGDALAITWIFSIFCGWLFVPLVFASRRSLLPPHPEMAHHSRVGLFLMYFGQAFCMIFLVTMLMGWLSRH